MVVKSGARFESWKRTLTFDFLLGTDSGHVTGPSPSRVRNPGGIRHLWPRGKSRTCARRL